MFGKHIHNKLQSLYVIHYTVDTRTKYKIQRIIHSGHIMVRVHTASLKGNLENGYAQG